MLPELKSKSDVSIVLVVFTALAILGVAGGSFLVQDYARARASDTWPAVDGIVLSHLDENASSVRYVYSIDGRSYESTRERGFLAHFVSLETLDPRPGETVTVYVNPDNHGYAVLYPGGSSIAFIVLSILSGAAIFFGVGGVVWTLSRATAADFQLAEDAA
ncbi:MAG: DUF3592 domain-containing protein [Pseudomonadota bacterium]